MPTQLSDNFTLEEMLKSHDAIRLGINNSTSNPAIIAALEALARNILEPVRRQFGPVLVSSGYRSPALNQAINGSANSQHMNGEAADFEVRNRSNYDIAAWIESNCPFDQLILEFYETGQPSSGWVHCSYKAGNGNRRDVRTFDGRTYQRGLIP